MPKEDCPHTQIRIYADRVYTGTNINGVISYNPTAPDDEWVTEVSCLDCEQKFDVNAVQETKAQCQHTSFDAVGIDTDGGVICACTECGERWNCGETVEEFLAHGYELEDSERVALGLPVEE